MLPQIKKSRSAEKSTNPTHKAYKKYSFFLLLSCASLILALSKAVMLNESNFENYNRKERKKEGRKMEERIITQCIYSNVTAFSQFITFWGP